MVFIRAGKAITQFGITGIRTGRVTIIRAGIAGEAEKGVGCLGGLLASELAQTLE